MAATSFIRIRDSLNEASGSSNKADFSVATRVIFAMLNDISKQLKNGVESSAFRDDNLGILEELTIGKKVPLTRSLQTLLLIIFRQLSLRAPGYIVRSLLNCMVNVCNNKLSSSFGRECAISVLSHILVHRVNDCASQITDVYQTVSKFIKATELCVRIAVTDCLNTIVIVDNAKSVEMFIEISKVSVKMLLDKSTEIKISAMALIETLAKYSNGFSTIQADILLPALTKVLDDENSSVQDTAARVIAAVHNIQITTYTDKQEQSKIGAARGGSDATTSTSMQQSKSTSAVGRLSLVKLPTLKKIVVEEVHDYRTLIENLTKQFHKSNTLSRIGYLFVLGYLIKFQFHKLSTEDVEWTLGMYVNMFQDPSIQSLSYEEQNVLRIKFSFNLRHNILSVCNENHLLAIASHLIKLCNDTSFTPPSSPSTTTSSSATTRSDLEIQFLLLEINHLLQILQSASISIIDDMMIHLTIYLRHMHYTVRVLASNVIVSICQISSTYIPYFISNAMLQIRNQIKPLSQFDQFESTTLSSLPSDLSLDDTGMSSQHGTPNTTMGSTTVSPNPVGTTNNPAAMSMSQRRRSIKDMEKLQRIYCFHGYILVIYGIVQHLPLFSQSLSNSMIQEIMELGIELMSNDITTITNIAQKNILCSFIRAGSLLLSAMCTIGYKKIHSFIPTMIQLCYNMIQSFERSSTAPASTGNASSSPVPFSTNMNSNEELLYEVMTMETAIIILISLMKYVPEILTHHVPLIASIVQSVEGSYSLLKNKYQFYHKAHYRVRILNILLLELYTLIPNGFYPTSNSMIYVETLKMIRDHVSNSLECTIGKLTPLYEDYLIQSVQSNTQQNNLFYWLTPLQFPFLLYECNQENDVSRIYQLEYHVNILSRKENESFLSIIYNPPSPTCSLHKSNDISLSSAIFPTTESSFWASHHEHLSCLSIEALHGTELNGRNLSKTSEHSYRMIGNAYQSACIETRTADVAIQLLAITFPHQSSEFQDKAIQLFTQALQQILSNSGSGNANNGGSGGSSGSGGRLSLTGGTKGISLFTSSVNEEEKKRKEKKNAIVVRSIVLAIHAIVNQFPVHSGQYYDVDYAWRQSLVDTLYSLLNYGATSGAALMSSSTTSQYATYTGMNPLNVVAATDSTIRLLAAQTLAQFADKWKGSSIMSHISSRIRTNIIMTFEKKVIDMNDYNGYVAMLGYLWIHSPYLSEVQSLAQTTLFDCLRKADSSIFFQAHVFSSINVIVMWFLHNHHEYNSTQQLHGNGNEAGILVLQEVVEDLFEKIIYVTEFSLMHVNVPEDLQVYITSLLQLINSCLSLGLLYEVSTDKYISRLFQIWKILLSLNHTFQLDYDRCHLMKVKKLHFQGIGMILTYDKKNVLTVDVLGEFENAIGFLDADDKCGVLYDFNPQVILEVVNILCVLSRRSANVIMERGYLICFYIIYDICYEHLVKCTFSKSLQGVEIKFDQIFSEYDYSTIITTSSRVRHSLLELINQDIKAHSSSNRLLYWLLMQRNIALGVKDVGGAGSNKQEASEESRGDEFDDDDRVGSASHATGTAKSKIDSESIYIDTPKELLTHVREFIQHDTPQCTATYSSSLRLSLKILSMKIVNSLMDQYFQDFEQLHCHLRSTSIACQSLIDKQPQHKWTKEALLSSVPLSFGWFLNEFINLACSMTTYTINDFNIVPLQMTGLKLLADMVVSYIRSDDLESGNVSTNATERLILNQYLSQILSSIRIVLSGGNSGNTSESNQSASKGSVVVHLRPEILQDTKRLLTSLIHGNLIQDKIMLKRVLKPIVTFCEKTFASSLIPINTVQGIISTRFPSSKEFQECQYIQEQCLYMNLIQQLLLNSSTSEVEAVMVTGFHKKNVTFPMQSTLFSSFQEFLPYIQYYGKHIFYDTLRILLYHPENVGLTQDNELPNSIIQTKCNSGSDILHMRTWEQFTKELHPLRGGNTYTPLVTYAQLLSLLPAYLENCCLHFFIAKSHKKSPMMMELFHEKEYYLLLLIFLQRLDPTHSYNVYKILDNEELDSIRPLYDEAKLWEYFLQLFLHVLTEFAVPTVTGKNERTDDRITWTQWIHLLQRINHMIQQAPSNVLVDRVLQQWTLKHYLLLTQIITVLSSITEAILLPVSSPNGKCDIATNAALVHSFVTLYELSNVMNYVMCPCLFTASSSMSRPTWLTIRDQAQMSNCVHPQVQVFLRQIGCSKIEQRTSHIIESTVGDLLNESYHVVAIQQLIQTSFHLSTLHRLLLASQQNGTDLQNVLNTTILPAFGDALANQQTLYLLFVAILQSIAGCNSSSSNTLTWETFAGVTSSDSSSTGSSHSHYLIAASTALWEQILTHYSKNTTASSLHRVCEDITCLFLWLWTMFPTIQSISLSYATILLDHLLQAYFQTVHHCAAQDEKKKAMVESATLLQITAQDGKVYSVTKIILSLLLRSYQQSTSDSITLYSSLFLTCIKYIQSYPQLPLTTLFQSSLFPLILLPPPTTTTTTTTTTTNLILIEVQTTHLKGFLVFYNLLYTAHLTQHNTHQIEHLLRKSLPWLCHSISSIQSLDRNYLILTGKALTQMARTLPDIFKAQILLLSDEQRQLLQGAMKAAILQEQQQQQQQQHGHSSSSAGSYGGASNGSSGSGGGLGGGMKISLDKYKK